MLPSPGCDPEINVVVLGAKVLKKISFESVEIDWLLESFSTEVGVSVDHVILSLDWLYMIGAVYIEGERIRAYEIN
ncbi:ABC-three component system middle component 6 [Pseudomonas pharyngis]|uniref:ABC-three component system middle component 6 n=1 Tax=Pseudomonas pharyngis TaxID=2892333 RepID=UPI001F2457C4|nr:ABC-three component system middle component 6 [Pseudomonas pharyngis]